MDDGVQPVGRQRPVDDDGQGVNAGGQQIAQRLPDDVERQIEDQQHHADEDRDGRIFARQDPVGPDRAQPLLTLVRLDDTGFDQRLDEGVAHVGDGRVAVKPALELHLDDRVLDELLFILVQMQLLHYGLVPVDDPGRGEADGEARALRVVLDLVADGVDAAVHRAGRAEIDDGRQLPGLGRADRRLDQRLNAVAGGGADRDDRHAQLLREAVRVDAAAVAGQLVHHVERQHRRHAQRQQLQRQIEVALEIRRVDDVDDAVGLVFQDEIAGHDLLRRVGAERVDARQIDHGAVLLPADGAGFLVDRDAGEIADMLVGACQLVEQRRFAAVLVAGQGEDHSASSSMVMLCASSLRSVSV